MGHSSVGESRGSDGAVQNWQIPGVGLSGLVGCDLPATLVPCLAIRARQLWGAGARLGLPHAMGYRRHMENRRSEPREHLRAHLLEAAWSIFTISSADALPQLNRLLVKITLDTGCIRHCSRGLVARCFVFRVGIG